MKEAINKLFALLRDSVITQSMLVIAIFGPIAYLAITGKTIPPQLVTWGSVVIGFFFGSKTAYAILKGKET
jgi:hypothetical protein